MTMTQELELDDLDRQLINSIQLDFPLDLCPFRTLGDQIGISEQEVIDHLKRLTGIGVIRKIGPILNTKGLGGASTLVAMRVPEDAIDGVASWINGFDEVSHNYLRPGAYNIWFTVSASSKERLHELVREIEALGHPFLELPVTRLFKIGVKFEV
ncbi:MAG: putative HTH-type transcriptional regulator [Candidatus Methanogaster sp.]|nr:MAG: putative HTH-type transcriptional regulator [ANME-2 cluster archaeon]